ncbi:hypothetical protein [Mycolicibacterium celeriflavum]|uniref:hypothetical protein n=1 Tax=Mycolicibacterium celeriflavum TaxID=1249101 RepID=UPI003CE88C22
MNSSTPSQSDDPGEARWERRFDEPLTVTPRQVRPRSTGKTLAIGVAGVAVVAAIGGLIFWATRPSEQQPQQAGPEAPVTSSPAPPPTSSEDDLRLARQLPKGYPAGTCETTPTPEGVLSQVNCVRNVDPDGPASATFSLVGDPPSLDKVFNDTIGATVRVDCPGSIQSPGPWRRNATPDKISGQLYCGLLNGQPTVVWTDAEKMTVSAVRAGPDGPTFPQLYAWWSSHS